VERITKYEAIASSATDLFDQNIPTGEYLGIMVAALIGVWTVRYVIHLLINNPDITTPCRLTEGMLYEYNSLNYVFTDEFLASLTLDCLSPITPEVLDQLKAELIRGDELLLDAGLDIIVGIKSIPLEELTSQVLLLFV
jgi:hypothetical protein